jgi:tetratricopeptide (TPR) repeat protein
VLEYFDPENQLENQQNYLKLLVALEASSGMLNLLIAVCDDRNLRETLMQRYEAELAPQGFRPYRVRVQWQDPSLRLVLLKLQETDAYLQQNQPAVVTVLGIDELLAARFDALQSEQDRFFGYLQWTREALQQFKFPIVLWVSYTVLQKLAERAPDFWSWRGGVFWFEGKRPEAIYTGSATMSPVAVQSQPNLIGLPLEELQQLIEQIEQQQGKEAPLLASLYDSLGQTYAQRYRSGNGRQLAIQAYERAIKLQQKLNLKAELADSFWRLGNLYAELYDNVNRALECYEQAIGLYREVGSKVGEANTLQAIGDVLKFLDRRNEALSNYEQAIELYREVGARLGEANTLRAIGDVLQFLDRRSEALSNYEQAIGLYREVGDRLGEANTLIAIGDVLQAQNQPQQALDHYQPAIELYRTVGSRLGEANVLQAFGKLQADPAQALDYLQQAQALYEQINDGYSQSRNLLEFIANAQLQLDQKQAALASLGRAAELAKDTEYAFFYDDALRKIAELEQVEAE